jgi:hypothetical protein
MVPKSLPLSLAHIGSNGSFYVQIDFKMSGIAETFHHMNDEVAGEDSWKLGDSPDESFNGRRLLDKVGMEELSDVLPKIVGEKS